MLVLAAAGSTGLVLTAPKPEPELQPPPPIRIVATTAQRRSLTPVTRVRGQLQPSLRAELRFELAGRLVERRVEPGQRVQADELLLRIDDGDLRDAVTRARARLSDEEEAVKRDRQLRRFVKEQLELSLREAERLSQLSRESLASASAYEQAQRQALLQRTELAQLDYREQTAEARLALLRAELEQVRRNLRRSRLTAPFAGAVNRVTAQVGDYVGPNAQVVELVRDDPLDLHLEITGEAAAPLRLGQEVEIEIDAIARPGRIVALEAAPNPLTHTHTLRVRIPAQEPLYAGLLADALLPGRELRDAVVVPATAVLQDGDGAYIFRIERDRAVRLAVRVLQRYEGEAIVEGIRAGDRFVARDVAALVDDQPVSVSP